MIAFILFQINILTLTLFSVFFCTGKKKNYDGEGDVDLIPPCYQKSVGPGGAPPITASSSAASKPMNDDFAVGVPLPHIPLADKSDERTLADIESIQSEKAMIREKKSKLAAANAASKTKLPDSKSPANGSTSTEGGKVVKAARSPAAH